MVSWKISFFNKRYTSSTGWLSIVVLVSSGVRLVVYYSGKPPMNSKASKPLQLGIDVE